MELHRLEDFTGGWFVGNFHPSLMKSTAFEVSIKRYKAGESDVMHHHKIATEFTVIVDGSATMNGTHLISGDIVVINPGESAKFVALSDTTTCVVKSPSVKSDKYSDE